MGQVVTTNLVGKQEGEYEMDVRTGMLIKSNINAHVTGTIQIMGKDVPVEVTTVTKMIGNKVNK